MTVVRLGEPRPDSSAARVVRLSLGYRRGRFAPRASYAAIVVHTTGRGVLARFAREGERKGDASPFETALRIYATIMDAAPHYVIGPRPGEIAQVTPESHAAWHTGSSGWRRYQRPRWAGTACAWWHERWPELASPLDLALGEVWAGHSPNANTVGIEFVPDPDDPTGPLTAAAWASFVVLQADIRRRRAIPLHPARILTHSDVAPLSRSARGRPWDLAPDQWRWELFKRAARF